MALFAKWCCSGMAESDVRGATLTTVNRSGWQIFSLKDLQLATADFSHDNKIGEGGFGTVYWGQLSCDGSPIAVKRLKVWSTKAEMEFAVEVEILGRVRHKNLLSLRGYCAEGQERLIVYDFMPNLSLVSHLHGKHAPQAHLHWQRRMRIAIGSAEGLAYLHHHVRPHIIHRDVKASNVLLDSEFEAQVADFGFAKLIPEGVSHVTTRVKGTWGYLAPEYALWGKVSESCDVYSFGILLLELISGKKPIERLETGGKRTIVEWAAPLVYEGRLNELVDPRLEGNFDSFGLVRLVQAASMCAQNAPENRPTMLDILHLLKGHFPERAPMQHSRAASVDHEGGDDNQQHKRIEFDPVKYEDDVLAQDDTSEDEHKKGEEHRSNGDDVANGNSTHHEPKSNQKHDSN